VDEAHLRRLWASLVPQTCHVMLLAPPELPGPAAAPPPEAAAFRTERYMKASYRVWPFAPAELAAYDAARRGAARPALSFPPPNAFLPRSLQALPPDGTGRSRAPCQRTPAAMLRRRGARSAKSPVTALLPHPLVLAPQALEAAPGASVLFLPDCFFGNPTVRWSVRMHSELARSDSARAQCLVDLFLRLAYEKLTPLAYPASKAGLSFHVSGIATGPLARCPASPAGLAARWPANALARLLTTAARAGRPGARAQWLHGRRARVLGGLPQSADGAGVDRADLCAAA